MSDENVYTSLPQDLQATTTYEDRDKVFKFLFENKGKYMTAKNISIALGYEHKDNSVFLRKVITELIEFNSVPIIASQKGFKISSSKIELQGYIESLNMRAKGIERRVAGISRCLYSENLEKKNWWTPTNNEDYSFEDDTLL